MSIHVSSRRFLEEKPPRIKLKTTNVAKPSSRCFICGKNLGEGYSIRWQGPRRLDSDKSRVPEIFMHPCCATELVLRLVRDLHEFEAASFTEIAYVPRQVDA